jgi:hypothetical protein
MILSNFLNSGKMDVPCNPERQRFNLAARLCRSSGSPVEEDHEIIAVVFTLVVQLLRRHEGNSVCYNLVECGILGWKNRIASETEQLRIFHIPQ